jgi:hypothetical protein
MKKEHRTPRTPEKVLGEARVSVLEAATPSTEKHSPWIDEAMRALDALRELAPNWDSYGAEPPAEDALQRAHEVIEALDAMRFRPDRVAASAEGGVAIAFVREGRYADVECFNSGEMLAVISDGRGRPEVWEVAPDELGRTLNRIRDHIDG